MEYLQEIQDIIIEMELSEKPIKEIAHYTSIDALNSIIDGIQMQESSKAYLTLRATSALKTDDPEELQEGSEFLMDILSHLEEDNPDKFRLSNYMNDVHNTQSLCHLSADDIRTWFLGGMRTLYIISFSRYIDQLSMWLLPYPKCGEGACLVFDFSLMNYSNDHLTIRPPFPIIYGKRLGYLNLKNGFLDLIWSEYGRYCKNVVSISEPEQITRYKLQALEVVYAFVTSYFKREKWHNQQEIRIMCTTLNDNPSCVMTDAKNREYVEVPVPITCLKQVILGPNVHDSQVGLIKEKLAPFGFITNDIFKSKEPLR